MAERTDFLTQLASSQYQQELHWQQQASQPLLQDAYPLTPHLPESVSDALVGDSGVSSQVSSPGAGETAEEYRPLFQSIILLQQAGVSQTKIIETVLGKRGKYFNEGKAILAELLELGHEQGWDKE